MKDTEIATSRKIKVAASQKVKERDYWLNKLSGELVKSYFPYDYRRTGEGKIKPGYNAVKFRLSNDVSSKLVRLSNKSHHRLHLILVAGLMVLLEKYTGNKDIIVGTPIYEQDIEAEFINAVLALRNNLQPDMTFKELLLQVRQTTVEALENQNYPIEALLYKLNMSSSGDDFPLFDAAILLENIHDKNYLKNIRLNMVFSFLKTDQYIEGTVEYNALLYEKTTIERITGHWQQLFREVISDLNARLADINILPEKERNRVLVDFNSTNVKYPKDRTDRTIHQLLEEQVENTPDKTAVICNDQYLTYRALNEKANRLAGLLREKGVKQESIVGIIMEPSLELIIGIAGILKAGGAYLPIDPEYPEKRILSILRESHASILLTKEKIINAVAFTSLKDIRVGDAAPVVTAPRPQIKDFNGLPFPDRTLIDYERYHQSTGIAMAKHTVSLQATRGCPFNCAFCHKIWPKNHVARSAENILAEIKYCYDAGARRFTFIDDVFNLNKDNVARLMEKIIKSRMDIQLFFPNGLRGDILSKEAIDLMVEAGTVNVDLALESASPRIQKLINKNLNLEKFRETARYFTEKYPQVLLEMELMIGFPSETEEEARVTMEFLESLKWVHFPNLNILKIYPNTDMYRLAVENSISPERIERSTNLVYHQLPETLPFSKSFTGQIQMRFMNEYFLSKERLLHVLPHQAKTLTEEELIRKYDSYLPMKIERFSDILKAGRISRMELGDLEFLPRDHMAAPGFRENLRKYFPPAAGEDSDALRVLLLDLSLLFSSDSENILYDMIEEPLGLTYLLTYLKKTFERKIRGKIGKSRMDFDNYDQLKTFIRDFNPDLIGIRTLSYYKEFFHKSISLMRQWGVNVPIIAGGPYATSDYQLVLNDPNVDIVVVGEGEITFAQLMEKVLENDKKLPDDDVLKDIPGIAFVKREDKTMLRETGREVVFLDNTGEVAAPYPGENPGHVNQPGDLLYLISTSGSTGIPKSLMMEHRNLANLLNFQFFETDVDFRRVLQFASIGFDVSAQEIFSALLAGGELYLVDNEMKRDVYRLLELMRRNHLNVVYWPPAFLKYVFSEADHRARFPKSVEHIITAGEQLVITEPIRRYIKENHVYLHNHYGPAETHVVTTFVIDSSGDIPELPPIGKPIANTRIYILDENKKVKPVGTIGELYIAGANVGRGYHRRKEITAEKFIHLPASTAHPLTHSTIYRTGDLARWLPDGNIEFIGRADYQVKVRGFRIELGEIETRLMGIDVIKEAVVVDYKDAAGEKYLCAYIIADQEVEPSEIKDILSNDLPGYMLPSYFVQMEKIPVTPNGKIDKKVLPMPEIKVDESYAAPRDEMEKELAGIWSEVLGIERGAISIDADFFELGGHSLKATILITRIHKAFNVRVTLGEMFQQPTIRGLSELIKKAGGDIFSAIQPEEKKEYYPLSSAQKRIYVLQRLEAMKISYNNPSIMILRGEVRRENFEEVLQELIKRHETLRISFEMMGEEPVQRVHEIDDVAFEVLYHEMSEEEARKRVAVFVRPFELEQVPLLRVELVKLEEDRFLLMYDMHHIITDGTSIQVFAGEFMALYGGEELVPLRVHYKDFSGWQNRLFASGKIKKQQEYWLNQFEGEIPVLNLPTDFPRPEIQSFEGSCAGFQLGSEETRILREVAKEENATLYMVLLSIYNVLLSKVSGQEDIVVGSPIAGRRHADLHFIIGMFINTLASRNFPGAQKTFREFLGEVKERTLAAFENQDYPFEELVDQLEVNRDASRNPLLDVVMVLQNMAVQSGTRPEVESSGLRMEPYKMESEVSASKFDMTLIAVETGNSLSFVFEYCSRLFRKETIERFIAYFRRLAANTRKNLDKRLSEIEIISGEEKNRLLFDFNRTESDYPKDKTIYELFKEQVGKTPDGVAVVGQGAGRRAHSVGTTLHGRPGKEVQHLTYRELDEKSSQLAHHLRSKGVEPDIIVGLKVERSIKMIIGILGILKACGAYLPIDPDFPEERIRYMLADSNARILLSELSELSEVSGGTEVIDLPSLIVKNKDAEPTLLTHPAHPTHLCYVIYTSGTTGRPKGVLIRHQGLVNMVWFHRRVFKEHPGSRISQVAGAAFDAMAFEVWPCLLGGAALYIVDNETRMHPKRLKEWLIRNRITISFQSTLTALELLDEPWPETGTALKALRAAGEKLTRHPTWSYPFRFYNLYGPTEDTVWTTWTEVPVMSPSERMNPPSIGKPAANKQVYILDEGLKLQPVGVVGELCISGDGLARGYLNNPESTAEKFTNCKLQITNKEVPSTHKEVTSPYSPTQLLTHSTIYRTGDLARCLPDGNIEFVGRIDQQVKIRGFRIELSEIENHLLSHEKIKEVVVVVKERIYEGSSRDKYLCAYLVSAEEMDNTELRVFLSQSLPDFMIPSYFMQIEKIPLTANGKVDRKRLPVPEIVPGSDYVGPRDEVEERMVEMWSGVLGIEKEKIGVTADFFELGGHSLKATTLVARIHKVFNTDVPLEMIFRRPTIRRLAEYISNASKAPFISIQAVEKKEYYELSSAQKRLFVIQQMGTDSVSYNVPLPMVLEGELSKEYLEGIIGKLIKRHESLRTSFVMIDQEPMQRVHEDVEFEIEYYEKGGDGQKSMAIHDFVRSFDLSQAPLLRVGLFQMEKQEHVLILDMHHIITDGSSLPVLSKEFMDLYAGKELKSLRIQYKDYAQWQKDQKEKLKKQEAYWLNVFKADVPVLNLPADYPRPAVQSFEGHQISFVLDSENTKRLREMATDYGATLYIVLLAVFNVLLTKLSGQDDIVVGTPTAGRRHAELEPIIGMFVNTIGLRNSPTPEKTFDDFLKEVKERTLEAFENQEYQFEDLVEQVPVNRDAGRNPLFDVMFVLQNVENPVVKIPGLKLRPYEYEMNISKFDLSLTGVEGEKNLLFSFDYCTKLFKKETIERFMSHFNKVLSGIVKNPGKKLADIEIISEIEKNRILYDFNNAETAYPGDKTIHELFEIQVEKTPHKIAVVGSWQLSVSKGVTPPANNGEKTGETLQLTYRELNQKSDQLAHLLREKGVQPNTIVGLMVERSIEMIFGTLGILKAGGAYLPVDTGYPGDRTKYMLADSNAKVLLAVPAAQVKVKIKEEFSEIIDISKGFSSSASTLTSTSTCQVSPTDLAYVIYTSGSTGRPKGVMVEQQNVIRLVKNTNYIKFNESDRLLQTGALEFDASTFEIWGSLLNGLSLYLASKEEILAAESLKGVIRKYDIGTIWLTSPLFNQLSSVDVEIFAGLRNLLVGGDVLSPVHINRVRSWFPGLNIINGYGPTENTTFSTTFLIMKDYTERIPIGKPIANSTAYIVDRWNKLVPVGVVGELCVGGDGVARGYLNNPELTAEKFIGLWEQASRVPFPTPYSPTHPLTHSTIYRTGDLARWLEDGNIEFLGRFDFQVKVRGYRIELGEIETCLVKHPEVKEAVVMAKENEVGEKYLCAYMVFADGSSFKEKDISTAAADLKKHLTQSMPDYMNPSYFMQIEEIPLTPNGKVDFNALPVVEIESGTEFTAPRNEVEEKLADIWSKVLNIEKKKIGINADFFELGGHSLRAVAILAKIHKELNVKIPLEEVFKTPTLEGLSEYIKKSADREEKFVSIEPVEEKEYYALSSAQKRLYIQQHMQKNNLSYNMPHVSLLEGKLGKERLEEAIKQLIKRHGNLRTSFEMMAQQPIQRIHHDIDFAVEYDERSEEETVELVNTFARPFDLSKVPLLRVKVVKVGEARYLLMYDMHHIISDGTSMGIFVREFMALYVGKELPPLRIQYKDFSRWQNYRQGIENIKKQEEYWSKEFEGVVPVLNLPIDYERPAIQTSEGNIITFEIDTEETKVLKEMALEEGVTLYMVLLAVFNVLLSRQCDQEDITIGAPTAGRNHADLEPLIGFFINMLAIRNFPTGHKTFRDFLLEVKEKTLKAFENQDYQFEALVNKVLKNREASRNSLVDVVFVFQNMEIMAGEIPVVAIPELTLKPYKQNIEFSPFDFILNGYEAGEKLVFSIHYRVKLFKEETIQRTMRNLKEVVSAVIDNKNIQLGDIKISHDLLAGKSTSLHEDEGDFGF